MSDRANDPDHPVSIETLLTLGLTAAILAAAFFLRLLVLSVLRVGLRLAGKDPSWLRPQRAVRPGSAEGPPKGRAAPLRPRIATAGGRIRSALAATGAGSTAAAATLWTGAARGASDLERWADRTNQRLAPAMREITSAARRSSADIGKYVVAGIATVQHLVLLLGGWLRGLVSETRGDGNEAVPVKKVIDLDRDDDPLRRSPSARSRSVRV